MSEQNGRTVQEVIDEVYRDYERVQQELKEMDVLIKQSSAEVESLAQRNAQINSYVRNLKLDTAPREDIKDGYEEMLITQQRLFTMRGQLEKLQSDQRNLERLAKVQRQFLEVSGQFSGDMSIGSNGGGLDQSNVVRVIQTEEAAKQSLVRKMHDGPASSLSNFILQAEICERLFDSDPDRARHELTVLKESAALTFGKVKDFIFDLRPMMLDDLGVIPTLRSYINSFQDKNGLPVAINITGVERRLESHIEVTIFRAVQELLNNARTHGQASEIKVQLDMGQDEVTAVVEDNGNGFDVNEALKDSSRKTLGLPTLFERFKMLNGELEVESSTGQGTRAAFLIPIEGMM